MQVTQTLSEMLRVLEEHPSFHVDRSSIDFDEFIVHLKFLALKQFSDDPVLEQESPLSVSYTHLKFGSVDAAPLHDKDDD